VERCIRDEHIHEKIRGDKTVNLNPRRTDVVQPHVALDDEQCTDFIGRENLHRAANLADCTLCLLIIHQTAGTEKTSLTEVLERTSEFRLEHNRQRNKEQCHGLLKQP